jgi:hypothetical protein
LKTNLINIPKQAKLIFRDKEVTIQPGIKRFKFNRPNEGVIFDMTDVNCPLISSTKNWHLSFLSRGYKIQMVHYDGHEGEDDKITILWGTVASRVALSRSVYTLKDRNNEVIGYEFRTQEILSYGLLKELESDEGYYSTMFNKYTKSGGGCNGILFTVEQNKFTWAHHLLLGNQRKFIDAKYY